MRLSASCAACSKNNRSAVKPFGCNWTSSKSQSAAKSRRRPDPRGLVRDQLQEPLGGLLRFLGEICGKHDAYLHVEVTAFVAAELRQPLALEAKCSTVL